VIFTLDGLLVRVCKPEIADLPLLEAWIACADYQRNIAHTAAPARRAAAMLQENADDQALSKHFLIQERFGLRPIGLWSITSIDWKNRHAESSYYLAPEARGKALAGDVNVVMCNYLFNELNLNKVYSYTYQFNDASLRMNGFGARHDGTLRRHRRHGGAQVDVQLFSLTRGDFQRFVSTHQRGLLRKHAERKLITCSP
jgi:RimJ/RimL family protein N-acetyltransferase